MADTENQDPNASALAEDQEEVVPEEKFELLDADVAFKEEVTDVFDMFDKEKTQNVEVGSLGTILRWLKFNPTNTELAAWIKQYDPTQRGEIPLNAVYRIVNDRMAQPDTIDELIEAMKLFDHDNDGKVTVSEFRWFMSKLGDEFEEKEVDDLLKEVDKENTGFVDIM